MKRNSFSLIIIILFLFSFNFDINKVINSCCKKEYKYHDHRPPEKVEDCIDSDEPG